jgi:hypothetical protein
LWWLRSWQEFSALLTGWWYSLAGQEIRAAYYDTRRAPGWVVLGMIAVFWPITGFSLIPLGVPAVVWLLMMWTTRWIRYRYLRRRIRRVGRPLIGILALALLTVQAGVWAWILAIGLWLVFAGLTDTVRARARLSAWILEAVSRTTRNEPAEFDIVTSDWDGRRLSYAEVALGQLVRTEDQASRDRIAQAVGWAMRHAGRYTVAWPAGRAAFTISATPELPALVEDQLWDGVPGIPIGATDEETADGWADTVDSTTGDVVGSVPIALINPEQAERHYLVIGGTGAGKSVWIRGFIARGLRGGWWPGGVYILDGKGGSDYITFENREGIHCVARHPEEWAAWLPQVSGMMRQRYDDDADYHRGLRPKPEFPRYLVVIDEVQEIRSVLGKNEVDPFLQQLSRQMRASEGRLLLATQRPDTEDAIPGAVRDMLEERIALGYVSAHGARMVFGDDWRSVVDEYGADTVPGRGMARIMGRLLRIQGFKLDLPREHPEVEHLYPPKVGAHTASPAVAGPSASTAHWAPKAGDASLSDPSDNSGTSTLPDPADNEAVGASEPVPLTEPPASDHHGAPDEPRQRRRTV